MSKPKIIFAGTTSFGIPSLEALKLEHEIVLVITQPDKPVGRKQILTPPPIKEWAVKNNLKFLQPKNISEIKSEIAGLQADVLVVAAYGQIISADILDLPKYGSINIHGSVLPKYRGASPIQAALLEGDKETGITLIKMDAKMDHGPIVAIQTVEIDDNDDYLKLHDKLAQAAAELLAKTMPDFITGKISPNPQDETKATYTKLLTRSDAKINWTRKAAEIKNQIRALNPEPGTWTAFEGKTLKILSVDVLTDNKIELPGKMYRKDADLAIKCSDFSIIVTKVQLEGGTPMSGKDFLNGIKNLENKLLI